MARFSAQVRVHVTLLGLALLSGTAALPATSECGAAAFVGFDSRLHVNPVGRVPGTDPVVAFEIIAGKPAFAIGRDVFVMDGNNLLRVAAPASPIRLLADTSDKV